MNDDQKLLEISPELKSDILLLQRGTVLRRIKHFRALGIGHVVRIDDDLTKIEYKSLNKYRCIPMKLKQVEVSEMLEVRPGFRTDNFHRALEKNKLAKQLDESKCFSIVFRHKVLLNKTVDFLAECKEDQQIWIRVLRHLIARHKLQVVHFNETHWLMDHFRKADINGDQVLSFEEVWKLLSKLNLEISQEYGQEVFKRADIVKNETTFDKPCLDEKEFLTFFRYLTQNPELDGIMSSLSESSQPIFTPQDLQMFLIKEQNYPPEEASLDLVSKLIKQYEPDANDELLMSANGFRHFLLSHHGSAVSDCKEDMTQPLHSYFIYASHNTYALGHQMTGAASIEGYIRALENGARVLELDCFDGPDPNGDPRIKHGHTIMTPVSFTQVIIAINEYAFKKSPYPVILSIENHCSVLGQKQMAKIFKSIFGAKLYLFDPNSSALGSPEELKGRILIKGKMLKSTASMDLVDGVADVGAVSEDEEDSDNEEGLEADYVSYGEDPVNIITNDNNNTVLVTQPNHVDHVDTPKLLSCARLRRRMHRRGKKLLPLSHDLSSITALTSKKLTSIIDDAFTHPINSMASVSESKIMRFATFEKQNMMAYTSKHLVKAYPKGIRQDSSNMNPMPAWMCGIQCVSLNLQTADEENDLNVGLFSANKKCGYVLKPDYLLHTVKYYELEQRPVQTRLHLQLLSGQYLPKAGTADGDDILDPYVSIEIEGFPFDSTKVKSNVVRNNGFNPSWNQTFVFPLKVPEIALIRLCVKDYDKTSYNDFVGSYSAPVRFIREGYSLLRLMTGSGHSLDPSAALLVKLTMS